MAELMIDFITSLDGYASADGWPGWWGLEGPEYLAWLEEDSAADRTLLMGSTTYTLMHGFAAAGSEGVDSMDAARKVVFSNSLADPLEWANTELVRGDAVEAVRRMKKESPHPLSTLGSLSLCRSLMAAGLVDRFRLVVFPVITGTSGQERVYDGYPDVALDLIESRTFDGRSQLLDFVPRLLDGPLPPGPGAGGGEV
jgi:dihydrofolate reductase